MRFTDGEARNQINGLFVGSLGGVEHTVQRFKARFHDLGHAGAAFVVTSGPNEGKAFDLTTRERRSHIGVDAVIHAFDFKRAIAAIAVTRCRHDFQCLQDFIESKEPRPITRLRNQQDRYARPILFLEPSEGGIISFEFDSAGRDFNGDACGVITDQFHVQTLEDGVVLRQEVGTLKRGQNARVGVAVRFLPCAHGGAGATTKGAVDGGVVEPRPFQRDLKHLTFATVQRRFARAGLGQCFVDDGGFRRCFIRNNRHNGEVGCFSRQRLRFDRCTNANRPELLAKAFAVADKRIARDLARAAQLTAQGFGIRTGVGPERHAIPIRTQIESVHIVQLSRIFTRCILCGGQCGVRFELDPRRLLGSRRKRRKHKNKKNG